MSYVLVFRSEALEELDEAYNWYESQQPGLGDEFLEYVDEVLNRICQQPELYVVVYRDVRRVVLRRFPYVISYRIISSRIVITGVFQGRRDPKIWLKRT